MSFLWLIHHIMVRVQCEYSKADTLHNDQGSMKVFLGQMLYYCPGFDVSSIILDTSHVENIVDPDQLASERNHKECIFFQNSTPPFEIIHINN